MCMNSERVHKSTHMENTSGIIKPESGDQSRLNQPDNYNYNGPEVNYFDPVLENEIKDNANVIQLSEMDNEPSTPLTMHSRNSQDTANKSTYPSKKSVYGNLPLIDLPTEHFPHRPQRINKSTYSSKESIYGNLPLINLLGNIFLIGAKTIFGGDIAKPRLIGLKQFEYHEFLTAYPPPPPVVLTHPNLLPIFNLYPLGLPLEKD